VWSWNSGRPILPDSATELPMRTAVSVPHSWQRHVQRGKEHEVDSSQQSSQQTGNGTIQAASARMRPAEVINARLLESILLTYI
jgi:hypothetical protein